MTFLSNVYNYADRGEHRRGSIEIMKHINRLMCESKWDECNSTLDSVDVDRLPTDMALSFVTITRLVPDDELPSKANLRNRVKARLTTLIGAERAGRLID